MVLVSLAVNGTTHSVDVAPATLLVTLLRERLRLTGTHIGCDCSQCGACLVLMDGLSVKSCTVLAVQADGTRITTIEGVARNGQLHSLQEALRAHHGLQCGFCTPGMVISGLDLLSRYGPDLDEATVRRWLDGNLCRCTGYEGIVRAMLSAAADTETKAAVARTPSHAQSS